MRALASLLLVSLLAAPVLAAPATPPAKPASKAAAKPAAKPAVKPASSPAAVKLMAAVADRYRTLKTYRLEGQGTNEVGNASQHQDQIMRMRFVVERPGRYSSIIESAENSQRMVTDGDSLWTAVPALGQYVVRPVRDLLASSDSGTFARQIDPASEYASLLEAATVMRSLGRDTVHTARGVITCERVALTLPQPDAGANVKVFPRVLWVDPTTHMVLLDSLRVEQQHPQAGLLHSVNVTRLVVAEANPVHAADAFTFANTDGLRRVRRFMQGSPEHSSMEGQPAQDFTLETLADSKPVKLSDLKGKVVLLDFWATWCGPCRRWLPIVAQAARDYADKGLVVYAVNERETVPQVRKYLEQQKIDIPVLMDLSGTVGTNYRASSIPLSVVVGRDGNIVRVLLGLHDAEDLAEVLKEAGL
ncbi:MAG: redoxin domain-containing protein [Candidatus Eisenbacteria bacterium]|nr:redoxin domain-containing protein [Candidatus Eisenbacteria bacterium]